MSDDKEEFYKNYFGKRYLPGLRDIVPLDRQQEIELEVRPYSVSISPDGKHFVVAMDKGLLTPQRSRDLSMSRTQASFEFS